MSTSVSVAWPLVGITLLAMGLEPAGAVRASLEMEGEEMQVATSEGNMTAGKFCLVTENADGYHYGVSFAVPMTGKCRKTTCHGSPLWGTDDGDANSIYQKVITATAGSHKKCKCMAGGYKFYWFRASGPQCSARNCWYEFSTKLRQKAGKSSTIDLLTSPQHFDYECADAAPSPANQLPGMPPPANAGGATMLSNSEAVEERIAALEERLKDALESQDKGSLFDASKWQVILAWEGEADLDIHMTFGEDHMQSGLLVSGADHLPPFILDTDDQGRGDGNHLEHINLDTKDATLPSTSYHIYVDCFMDNRDDESVPLPFTVTLINFGGAIGEKRLMESTVCAGTRTQDVIKFTVTDGAISLGDR